MTDEELAAIRGRWEAAKAKAPEPWFVHRTGTWGVWSKILDGEAIGRLCDITVISEYGATSDPIADFISGCDRDIPVLLAEVERLQTAHGVYSSTVSHVKALEVTVDRLRAENAELRAELEHGRLVLSDNGFVWNGRLWVFREDMPEGEKSA